MSIPSSDLGNSYQPLEYASPVRTRPGILTAVGIISIIVGSLGVIGSLGSVVSGIMYLAMSNMTFPTTVTVQQAPATMPGTAGAQGGSPTWTVTTTTSTNSQSATVVGGGAAAAPGPAAGAIPVATPPFSFHVARGASALTIAEAVPSLGVAVLLIFAGSLMLRDSPKAWRLHRIYLVLKVPLVVVGAFATWWTFTSMMQGFNLPNPAGPNAVPMAGFSNMMAVFQATFAALFSMIYPVALMIVLSTRTSKEYLQRLQTGGAK
jgi:hypothetical protein